MKGKKNIGKFGEELVCGYLVKEGHCILEKNWRTGHLEIDIISMDKDGIHFVEVKTRIAPLSASPLDNVGVKKQRRIAHAASGYISGLKEDIDVFLDVATVVIDKGSIKIEYFKNAYLVLVT